MRGRGKAVRNRQLDAVVVAYEQWFTERLLKALDALGQRLLGEEQTRRGPAEVEVVGGGDERTDVGEIEVHPLTFAHNLRLSERYNWLLDTAAPTGSTEA